MTRAHRDRDTAGTTRRSAPDPVRRHDPRSEPVAPPAPAGNPALQRALSDDRPLSPRSPAPVGPGETAPWWSAPAAVVQRRTPYHAELEKPGVPLPGPERREAEAALGGRYGNRRLHLGPGADAALAYVGAQAAATGDHVLFTRDAWTRPGVRFEELEHGDQQRRGEVQGTDRSDGLRVSSENDADERAARAAVQRALSRSPRTGRRA